MRKGSQVPSSLLNARILKKEAKFFKVLQVTRYSYRIEKTWFEAHVVWLSWGKKKKKTHAGL